MTNPHDYIKIKAHLSLTELDKFQINLFAFDSFNYSRKCLEPDSEGKVVETFILTDKKRVEFPFHLIITSQKRLAKLSFDLLVLNVKGDTLGKLSKVMNPQLVDVTDELETKIQIKRPFLRTYKWH